MRKSNGLTKRGNIWHASFTDSTGRRVRRSTGTADKQAARQLYDQWKAESWRQSKLGERPRHTWQAAVKRFLQETTHKKSQGTDRIRLRQLDEYLGDLYLDQINADTVRQIVDDKTKAGLKPASIGHLLALIRTITRRAAFEWEWLDRPVKVPMPKVQNERTRVLGDDEEQRLIAALPDHLKDVVRFALATGLRKANIIGLLWEQIDLKRQVLTIMGDSMKAGRHHSIPLSDTALAILRRQRGKSDTHVFTRGGQPLKAVHTEVWKAACAKAGIHDVVFHDCRRTWATRLMQAGCSLDRLMRLGGWSSYNILLKRYGHLATEDLREDANRVSRPFVRKVTG